MLAFSPAPGHLQKRHEPRQFPVRNPRASALFGRGGSRGSTHARAAWEAHLARVVGEEPAAQPAAAAEPEPGAAGNIIPMPTARGAA
jgi:hypothetical protein